MLSHQLLQQALTELSAIVHTDFALLDAKNQPIASTAELPELIRENSVSFWESPSVSQSIPDTDGTVYHYFKLNDQTQIPLLLIAHGSATASYTGGCIALSQIKYLLKAGDEQMNREQFFLQYITGVLREEEVPRRLKQLRISTSSAYSLMLISIDRFASSEFRTILQQLFVETSLDTCLMIGDKQFALIRDLSRTPDAQNYLSQTAPFVADTLSSEAMVQFRIAYSKVANSVYDLPRVYREASLAMEAGKLVYPERQIYAYQTLGIGKLIYQLPLPLCESFAHEIFGDEIPEFDEELLSTVNRFFKNSLNVSETARQLYLHRNTLVYRLERVQKLTGLDIRNFEDALTFRIAWMAASRIDGHSSTPS
ncbi:MAG: helix-turn-helix domain-containing protein [Lachnospiraceae bacterium]|nr:helix-turn-helix domain-containing protein [Lachnospiraceae bacterium]